ncbi:MAG: AAA family ATPase [Deltaproteobacteria bacterium]|nr:AAA family ATPase [Deltaproteobacteria bacterium]
MTLELSTVLPYPELSKEHRRVLEMLWNFHAEHARWPREDEVGYYAKCDLEVVRKLAELKLITTARAESGPDMRRPTALGLAYVSAAEARSLLEDVDVLMRYVASRFHPDIHELSFDEITAALELEEARLLELGPFADDLQLHVRQHGVGSWNPWSSFADGVTAAFARMDLGQYDRRKRGLDLSASALPIRLVSLEVEHFRALSRLELELGSPLTVLVGPNGVGKSTTLDALGFLSVAARDGLAAALAGELGFSRLRERGSPAPVILRLGFELDAGLGFRPGEYLIELDDPRGVVAVTREELLYGAGEAREPWLEGSRAMTRLRATDGELEERYHAIDALGLEGVQDASRYPIVMALRHALASMALVDRDPIFNSRESFSEPNTIERPFGEEHPSLRGYRHRGASASPRGLLHDAVPDDASATRLGDVLSKLVPTVSRVERRAITGGPAELDVFEVGSDSPARVDELSQGTRQMLMLAALYVHPNPPAILLLEEPDAGLHPAVLQPLVDLLREMSERSSIVATTHSPYFVAMLDREREVVALQRHAEQVTAEPLAQALSSSRWLAAMDPAEAFFRRGLERAP